MSRRNKEQRSKRLRKLPPEKLHTYQKLRPQRPNQHRCTATGKVSWKTEFDALLVLGRVRHRASGSQPHKAEKRAYKCEHGDHWHLSAITNWDPELAAELAAKKRASA